ncbi:hypothetical protein F8M41_019001 [Gigaspora margarita]|uniref:Peptidase S1 domain-containing protein n=1 Tax=Gigaspora margarita TaxID=4874 RepID=A0A8H4B2C5_GIGMA|nr:hypothetical protein F8M41_019001 [Gigaspora margarita]
METIGGDSFGGIYVDVKANKLIVNINNPALENSTLLDPFRDFLLFNIVIKSLDEFPRKHVPMRPRQVKPKVLAGEGVFNRDTRIKNDVVGKICSIGFYARGKKRDRRSNATSYIITARSCYFKDSNLANSIVLRNWNTFPPVRYSELFITDARPATIVGGHICHSGFGTHVTCGNIKSLTAIYLNEDGSSSEGLIITDMNTRVEDIGGAVFFYKSTESHHVDLCGIQVISGSNLAAVLPSNIILENTKHLTLYKL